MGPTNAVKPPLIRFATSLVNKTDCDREIFRIGIYWGLIQVIMVTVFLFLLGILLELKQVRHAVRFKALASEFDKFSVSLDHQRRFTRVTNEYRTNQL